MLRLYSTSYCRGVPVQPGQVPREPSQGAATDYAAQTLLQTFMGEPLHAGPEGKLYNKNPSFVAKNLKNSK